MIGTDETDYPPVRVTDAPGYEDFDGWLLIECTPDWPVQRHVVGFEINGVRDVAVVPVGCVTPLSDACRCNNAPARTICRICRQPLCGPCFTDHHHEGHGTPTTDTR